MSLIIGLKDIGISVEGISYTSFIKTGLKVYLNILKNPKQFIKELNASFKGRRPYTNLFDYMKMQKYTVVAYTEINRSSKVFANPRPSVNFKIDTDDVYIEKMAWRIFNKNKSELEFDPGMPVQVVSTLMTHYLDVKLPLCLMNQKSSFTPISVTRQTTTLANAGVIERIKMISKRLSELQQYSDLINKCFNHLANIIDAHVAAYDAPMDELKLKKEIMKWKQYVETTRSLVSKWNSFCCKEYDIELNNLITQLPKDLQNKIKV